MSLQQRLQSLWYRDGRPAWWLSALVPLYRSLNRFDRWRQSRATSHSDTPVIVIGNLTVGGTGKTPMVLWCAESLMRQGLRPAVVSRGYGSSAAQSEEPVELDETSTPAEVGDEPFLIHHRLNVPVCVGRNRQTCVERLAQRHDVDVIISDDGLQHLRMGRNLSIVVFDGTRGIGNGALLPAGPLRRPLSDLAGVDLVAVQGAPSECFAEQLAQVMSTAWHSLTLEPNAAQSIDGKSTERALSSWSRTSGSRPSGPVHAIAGIGNPDRFFAMLQTYGIECQKSALNDHQVFSLAMLERFSGHSLLMTEKDAVKCQALSLSSLDISDWWWVPVDARLDETFETLWHNALSGILKSHPQTSGG